MNRETWLEERKRGLGGSDAAAALGLSKWKTPYQLYLEKRGESPDLPQTDPMRWGQLLEPLVIQRYADETGRAVVRDPFKLIWHPTVPFMFVSPDAIEPGQRLVEAKTARTREGWGEAGTDEIPQDYIIQVQHALMVTALPVASVPALFGGQEFAIYEVPANRELQEMIADGEADFWRRVEAGDPPDPATAADVAQRYGRRSLAQGIQATEEIEQALQELLGCRAAIEEIEGRREQLEVRIKAFMGENEALLGGRTTLATWKMDAHGRVTVDAKALAKEMPDVYARYARASSPSRRFLLK
ncbi:MAG TPA: YqaJ viral recombinase family protein [Caldimonas sp.]|nr:YqaJ viral recombinase family protein [Caldimonas sp.]